MSDASHRISHNYLLVIIYLFIGLRLAIHLIELIVLARFNFLGPVVQNFVSLTLSLSPQFVYYILTSKANTLLFFVEKKCETPLHCKGLSNFFNPKQQRICNIAI